MSRARWNCRVSSAVVLCLLMLAAVIRGQVTATGLAVPAPSIAGPVFQTADYAVRFAPKGLVFRAARSRLSWGFQLITAQRRATRGPANAFGQPRMTRDGQRIHYAWPGVVETYHVRPDGVEQSFTFSELPPGNGDLIVRGRVTTQLAVDRPGVFAKELTFRSPRGDGVAVGAVTGIDADGERVGGTMRFVDSELELVLPAAFVDRAALPLVLDPLIGTAQSTNSSPGLYGVAYEEASDTYLVVWGQYPLTVLAQRVRADATPLGPVITIGAGGGAVVAGVSPSGHFVVAWSTGYSSNKLLAATVNGVTGQVSNVTMVGPPVQGLTYAVGAVSDTTSASNSRTVITAVHFGNFFTSLSKGWQVDVGVAGGLQVVRQIQRYALPNYLVTGNQAVAECATLPGHYLLAADAHSSGYFFPRGVYAALIDPLGNVGPLVQVTPRVIQGRIDGEGPDFTLATGDLDIVEVTALRVSGSGTITAGSSTTWSGSLPSAALLRGSALVAYSNTPRASPPARSFVASLDRSTCVSCEGPIELSGGANNTALGPVIAARRRAGRQTTEALVAWNLSTGVVTQVFRSDDGRVTDLGGGCGPGGIATVSCARVGNTGFTHELRNAAAWSPAFLMLSAARFGLPCGPCTLVPDPTMSFVIAAGSTDAFGAASVGTPVPATPALVGNKLVEQWLVATGGGCRAIGSAFSNGAEIQIQ